MNDARLKKLISKSVYIMREAKAKYDKLGILWSGGKDSTVLLHLATEALGPLDAIKVVFLNTSFAFRETMKYMDFLSSEWDFGWIPCSVSFRDDFSHPMKDKFKCCAQRKTDVLRRALDTWNLKAVFVGIRRDEQAIRNKERFFSPRSNTNEWDYFNQPLEMQGWDLYVEEINEGEHMRVHPLLEWDEIDIWKYIKKYDIPVNPLYFAKGGKRMRSIGCAPCTSFIKSGASTVDEIIAELEEIGGNERDGRSQDKEKNLMGRLRAMGYM